MPVQKCGAAVRYWRFVIDQVQARIANTDISISEFNVFDSLNKGTRTPLLTQASDITLSHVPGHVEVLAPLDVNNDPILDGAILIDGNTATKVDIRYVSKTYPNAFTIDVDTGATISVNSLDIHIVSSTLGNTDLLYCTVYASSDGTTYQMQDRFKFPPGILAKTTTIALGGHGDQKFKHRIEQGLGFIPGLVSEDSLVKSNGRVFCYQRDGMEQVAESRTDENGNFIFYGMSQNKAYLITAVDDDGTVLKQPVSWDHVVPALGHKTFTTFRDQDTLDLYEITEGHLSYFCKPGLLPRDTFVVGGGITLSDRNYTENPFDSSAYTTGPYAKNSDGGFTAGTYTPLRADHVPVRTGNSTQGSKPDGFYGSFNYHPGAKGITLFTTFGLDSNMGSNGLRIYLTGENDIPYYGAHYYKERSTRAQGTLNFSSYQLQYKYLTLFVTTTSIEVLARTRATGDISSTKTGLNITAGQLHSLVVVLEPGVGIDVYLNGVKELSLANPGGDFIQNQAWYSINPAVEQRPAHAVFFQMTISTAINNYYATSGFINRGNFEIAAAGVVNKPVTEAQALDINKVLTGAYTPATSVYNQTGYEADIRATVPAFYIPMQDSSSEFSPSDHFKDYWRPQIFPGENEDRSYYPEALPANATAYTPERIFLSSIPHYQNNGLLNIGEPIPGKTRTGLKLAAAIPEGAWWGTSERLTETNTGTVIGMGGGISLIDTEQRTIQWGMYLSALPASGNVAKIDLISNTGDADQNGTANVYHNKRRVFTARVTDAGKVIIHYALEAISSSYPNFEFPNYVVPISTPVLFHVVFDLDANIAELYANGVKVDTAPVSSGFLCFSPINAVWFSSGGTDVIFSDIAAWPIRLPLASIQQLAGSW